MGRAYWLNDFAGVELAEDFAVIRFETDDGEIILRTRMAVAYKANGIIRAAIVERAKQRIDRAVLPLNACPHVKRPCEEH